MNSAARKITVCGFVILSAVLFLSFSATAQNNEVIEFWDSQTSNKLSRFNDVYFVNVNIGWTVGQSGTILNTTDGGVTWEEQESGTGNELNSVSFIDADNGWASGDNGTILHTADGGQTWNAQTSGSTDHLYSIHFATADTGWTVAYSNSDQILYTTDGGENWMLQTSNTSEQLISVNFVDAENGWISGTNGTIITTSDGGQDWANQSTGTVNDLWSVYFINADSGWAAGDNGTILFTSDGGQGWTAQSSGITSHLNSVHFVDADTGWAVGLSGTILRTVNGGQTWESQNSGITNDLNFVYFISTERGWAVGESGTILDYTALTSLSAPELQEPEDGSGAEPPVKLTWQEEEYPDHVQFNFHLSSQSDFSDSLRYDSTLTANEVQLNQSDSLKMDSTYYWKVRRVATDADSLFSEWSEASFKVKINEPVLLTPENEEIVSEPFELTWEEETDTQNYNFNVHVSSYESFSDTLYYNGSTTETSLQSSSISDLKKNRPFYWRVQRQYIHDDSLAGDWASRQFMIRPDFISLERDSVFVTEPNYLNIMLHASDATNEGITFLKDSEFELLENGSPISPTESRYQVNRLEQVESALKTVMVLDNSHSIGEENVGLIKEAASEFIRNKASNQEIAIYVFAREIEKVIDFTGNEQELLDIIDSIQLSDLLGTDLYGAAIEGLSYMDDDIFSLDYIEQNFMVLFTDGKDIAGNHTLDEVLVERGTKQVYTIGIEAKPDDFDEEALDQIGNAGTFINPNFENVMDQFNQVQQSLDRKSNSFYWLNYASATENETSELIIKVKNNTNTGTDSQIQYNFDASEFYATPIDKITVNPSYDNPRGVDSLSIAADDTMSVKIFTMFEFNSQPFVFTLSDSSLLQIEPHESDPFVWDFFASASEGDTLEVTIRDTVYTDAQLEKSLIINFTAPVHEEEPEIPEEISIAAERSFGGAADQQDYRLVALPGQIDATLPAVLNGNAGVDWQAFWDNGEDEDYLVKYDGGTTFKLAPGNGFWVTSKETFVYSETISAVELNTQNQAVIPLHEGWNIISNPLDIDVTWEDIQSANGGSLQPVWGFDGAFGESTSFISAKGGEAFYFLNDQGLEELIIPYKQAGQKTNPDKDQRELQLVTYVDDKETSTSTIVFSKSGQGSNPDVIAPPEGFEGSSLRFAAESEEEQVKSNRRSSLARLYRTFTTEGQSFDMNLLARTDEPVVIRVEGWDMSLSSELVLVDKETGQKYDLKEQSEIFISPKHEETKLLLLMGSSEFIDQEQGNVLPQKLEVMPNYPNPFNPTTTIQFALPMQSEVRLQIYDILGRQVSTLIDGVHEAGVHKVTFDARRQASGMYFAVFDIGGQRFIQKLTLIK